MIRKTLVIIFICLLFQSFQSSASIYKTSNLDDVNLTLDEIEATILPNVTNALSLGDSTIVNYLDIAACGEYTQFNFKKWNSLKYDLFLKAYKGYLVMKKEGMISNSRYLTVIDFELSSNQRRMWVLDFEKHKIVVHDLVSHGRNSGEEYARSFSNKPESFKSSLGFYVTGMPYIGKHDYSLRLHGVEDGFNDNAYDRSIVIHGAEYVCNRYAKCHKRIGRSQGCPAVSPKLAKWIINTIEGGSCLFIYYPDKHYLKRSQILNAEDPSKEFFQNSSYALNLP